MAKIEMCAVERTILAEVAEPEMSERCVAMSYRLGLQSSESVNWASVNRAIISRWGMDGLVRIKESAWSGACFSDEVNGGQ